MIEKKMLLTTSDSIPFSKIDKHLGVVDAQVVVGANIFRDFFASVRDIVGGESKGYMKDLDKMKIAAKRNLISKATDLGANAIISIRMDLNEVSGGGKSMFMFIMYGSAIKLEKNFIESEMNSTHLEEISIEDIEYYRTRNRLKKEIEKLLGKNLPIKINIDRISEYNLWSYEVLHNKLLNYSNDNIDTYNEKYKDKIVPNIKLVPIYIINKYLENNIDKIDGELWEILIDALKESKWYDLQLIKKLFNDENHIKRFRALRLSQINKEIYDEKDAIDLKEIGDFLVNDFDHSYPIRQIDKMIGKKKVFTCPNCLNDRIKDDKTDDSICKCGTNKYGLKSRPLSPKSISNYLIENSKAIKSAFEDMNK